MNRQFSIVFTQQLSFLANMRGFIFLFLLQLSLYFAQACLTSRDPIGCLKSNMTNETIFRAGMQLTRRHILENNKKQADRIRFEMQRNGGYINHDIALRIFCRKLILRKSMKSGYIEEIVTRRMKIPFWRQQYIQYILEKQEKRRTRREQEADIDALSTHLHKLN